MRDDRLEQDLHVAWMQQGSLGHDHHPTIQELKATIEERLSCLLEAPDYAPPNLVGAMRHALLGGGKRFRPLLFVLTVPQANPSQAAIDIACALEMVHTASLILDDLPCMDDAALRRGRATTHKVFGQSTAILAAISLLMRGMNIISSVDGVADEARSRLVGILSEAIGHCGLAAGQELDLNGRPDSPVDVERKNWLKTGKLFAAMADMALVLDDRSKEQAEALADLAFHIGSAFQALDDLLDVIAPSSALGKDVGKDIGKNSMVSDRGKMATRSSYLFHLNAADGALARCGIEKEPIRLMLSVIHQMAPREAFIR